MDSHSMQILLASFAEQQYMFSLLVKLLEEKSILQKDELSKRCNEKGRARFKNDLLEELVSRGLKISGDSPSASPEESPSASQSAKMEATDPESPMKS